VLLVPLDQGYERGNVAFELIAEGIRAYLVNPNYVKTAPRLAARIREAVNTHPTLSKLIQFNSLGGAAFGLTPRSDDQGTAAGPGRYDGA
jgi:hypothetical protein